MFEELVLDADAAIDWVLRGWERFAGAQTSTERLILLRYGPPQPFGYGLQFQRWKWAELARPVSETEYHPVAGTAMQFLSKQPVGGVECPS